MKLHIGKPDSFGTQVGIVAAQFNTRLADALFDSVVKELLNAGVDTDNIIAARVPGALELPGAVSKMLRSNELDVVFALGVVVKGETVHFDHVAEQAVRGLVDLSMHVNIPVVNGVLAGTGDQMKDRITGRRAKAGSFVETGLAMVDLYQKM